MDLNTVDLYQELKKEKRSLNPEEEAKEILNKAFIEDLNLYSRNSGAVPDKKLLEKLQAENIYDLESIRSLCIKFRLRFLDAELYKGEIPYEATQKVKDLERELGCRLNNFKIIAPKELFKLTDKDSDPILMVQLTKNKFYFIHKWGGEINRFRKALAYPLRNFETMFITLAAIALLFSIAVPTPNTTLFIFLVVHSFIAICGMACLVIMTFRENFSDTEWDSQYFS